MNLLIRTLCLSLLCPLPSFGETKLEGNETPPTFVDFDGPYIFSDAVGTEIQVICNNKAISYKKLKDVDTSLANKKTSELEKHCQLNDDILQHQLYNQPIKFTGDFKVAALSDLHGQYDLMLKLFKNNNIIDANGDWSFENGHMVITGDVFDRGDKVIEILWFLYKLEQQAKEQGGALHLLLGNHETMVFNADLRYLHPKYLKTAELLNVSYEQLFTVQDSVLGNWLRNKNVLIKLNNILYAHGGFHPELMTAKLSLTDINNLFKDNFIKAELDSPRDGWGRSLHKSNGPIWYRGYFKEDGASAQDIDNLLTYFDVKHIAVGHTSQKTIETRFNKKIIALDSSIKNGEYGEILFIDGDTMWRGTPEGKKIPLK